MTAIIVENLFPFLAFFFKKNKVMLKVNNPEEHKSKYEKYESLDAKCLTERISEEHDRGIKIDDKTSRFVLGLSISLAVIGAASGSFAMLLSDTYHINVIAILCGLSSLYMLCAGMTALGALKTLPTFGYGTNHEIALKKGESSYLAMALFCQENVNTVRHLRNEAAYQSLRNGFLILLVTLAIFTIFVATPDAISDSLDDEKNTSSKTVLTS